MNLQEAHHFSGGLFTELDRDHNGHYYLVVHCGSRHVGTDILNHYLAIAKQQTRTRHNASIEAQMKPMIQTMLDNGQATKINAFIKQFKAEHSLNDDQYATLSGTELKAYLNDVAIGQAFAEANRIMIVGQIIDAMNWHDNIVGNVQSVHNYYDLDEQVLRKGATSAANGKRIIIPLNMRDGSLLCLGKGNDAWNRSAPHGAGRQMSRSQAKETLTLDQFKATMAGIHSSSINAFTLDEAPAAYKDMAEIIDNIGDTADVIERIVPVYNFKDHAQTRGQY